MGQPFYDNHDQQVKRAVTDPVTGVLQAAIFNDPAAQAAIKSGNQAALLQRVRQLPGGAALLDSGRNLTVSSAGFIQPASTWINAVEGFAPFVPVLGGILAGAGAGAAGVDALTASSAGGGGAVAGTGATAAAGGLLPSTQLGTGFVGPITGGTGTSLAGIGAGAGAGTAGATITTGDKLANAGKLLASFGQGQANQRVSGGDLTQRYDQLALADQTGRNQTESDALKKLAQTGYILGGGSSFKAPSIQLNGQTRQLSDYGLGPSPVSDAQKQGAKTLQAQLLTRLAPGGTVAPTPPGTYTNPGTGENLGNYGSLALTGLGLAKNLGVF